jgi:Skp family chaperone for outer membrane proteins
MRLTRNLLAALALGTAAACSSVYYDTLENFGFEKRDILVDRVRDGREAQADAQEEFKDALTQFRELVSADGGELEKKYDKLSSAYDGMQREAKDVRGRIDAIEDVGQALFNEWEDELDAYQDASLRAASARQLRETRSQYDQVVRAMNRAADKMDPVLELFEDRVLFLKHNLNARMVAGLSGEQAEIQSRVDTLIAEMDAAIAEADAFIAQMQG